MKQQNSFGPFFTKASFLNIFKDVRQKTLLGGQKNLEKRQVYSKRDESGNKLSRQQSRRQALFNIKCENGFKSCKTYESCKVQENVEPRIFLNVSCTNLNNVLIKRILVLI